MEKSFEPRSPVVIDISVGDDRLQVTVRPDGSVSLDSTDLITQVQAPEPAADDSPWARAFDDPAKLDVGPFRSAGAANALWHPGVGTNGQQNAPPGLRDDIQGINPECVCPNCSPRLYMGDDGQPNRSTALLTQFFSDISTAIERVRRRDGEPIEHVKTYMSGMMALKHAIKENQIGAYQRVPFAFILERMKEEMEEAGIVLLDGNFGGGA